jgi:hypothetical protein
MKVRIHDGLVRFQADKLNGISLFFLAPHRGCISNFRGLPVASGENGVPVDSSTGTGVISTGIFRGNRPPTVVSVSAVIRALFAV